MLKGTDDTEAHLIIALDAAVPLHIEGMKDWSVDRRIGEARRVVDIVASQGDVLQFRSKKRGESAQAFNALARGMAVAAFQPGGVTFGRSSRAHWCVYPHPGCPQRRGRPAPDCCVCEFLLCPIARGEDGRCPSPAGCRWCRNGCAPECAHLAQPGSTSNRRGGGVR